jgi:uncharacterized membrane protein YidH (DUF202 family)
MKVKEWIDENVHLKREETEIRDNKGYCYTFGAAGLMLGVLMGIFTIIIQFAVSNPETQQTWISLFFVLGCIAVIGYGVWMLLPLFKSAEASTKDKVIPAVIAFACSYVAFLVGLFVTVVLFLIVVVILIVMFALKLWASTEAESRAKQSAPQHHDSGPEKFELSDGTIVTDQGFGSYSGNDGHSYERGVGDTFTRTD